MALFGHSNASRSTIMNCISRPHMGFHALPRKGSRYISTPTTPKAQPTAKAKPSSTAPPPPQPQSSPSAFSPKNLNAFAVNHLTARAHSSRPPLPINDGRLPDKYKPAARRITYALVAMPIAIVTSYMLWARCKWLFAMS